MNHPLHITTEDVLKASVDEIRHQVLSDKERIIFQFIFFTSICGLIGLCGTIANVINIVIFYKQGFTNTVNIAFCGLAVSDLCCMVALVWASICMNPLLSMCGVPWIDVEVMYLTAAWPHVCFCRITSYITVYITAERYLCIALPLKIKEIVTPTKTLYIIFMIFFVNLVSLVPECTTSKLGWKFVPSENMTLLGITFTSNRKSMEGICFITHSIMSMSSFLGVIIFTIILITKLRQSSKLRTEMTSKDHSLSMSARDKKTVKMIVLIASILILCYIPGATISMTVFVVGSDFNIQGRYVNVCVAVWSVACSCQSINSSVNIFLYYRMSTKYKQTFDDLCKQFRCNRIMGSKC